MHRLDDIDKKLLEIVQEDAKANIKEVADQLNIRIGTVKQHAHNIYKKLQVYNCVEAVLLYFNLR